jgi:muramidase (phage lysozyme)
MTVATNISKEGRAFLDALYVGESGGDYTILYGGGHFNATTPRKTGYYGFPDWPGKDNSHAAGAPQFEPATWLDTCQRLFRWTADFRNPADQDWGAWLLAQDVYKHLSGADLLLSLRAGALQLVAPTLQSTWTSLSDSSFPSRYRQALAALNVETPVSDPTPVTDPLPPAPPSPAPDPMDAWIASIEASMAALQAKLAKLQAALDALKAAKT